MLFTLCVIPGAQSDAPGQSNGSWHGEIGSEIRPRLLLLSRDRDLIRERLSQAVFQMLYNNNLKSRYGRPINGIYQKAMEIAPARTDWKQTAQRAIIAKDAAFVYYMNRGASGQDTLPEKLRDEFRDKVIQYLNEIDVRVRNCWKDYGDLQWRGKELMHYCQAFDLLMADPDDLILKARAGMEQKLVLFSANLFKVLDKWKEPWIPFVTSRDNKRIIAATALGVAALTLNDHKPENSKRSADADDRAERPDSWIGAAMHTLHYLLRTNSDASLITRDGSYREGPHYYRYVSNVVYPFIRGMKNFQILLNFESPWNEKYFNFGRAWQEHKSLESPYSSEIFRPAYDYHTAIRLPGGRIPALKDSYTDAYFPELALLADINPSYVWPISSFDPAWTDSAILNEMLGDHLGADLRVDYLCCLPDNILVPDIQSDSAKSYKDAGSYLFRAQGREGELYFHLLGGNLPWGNTSHYQADAASFMLNLDGQMLAIDPGYISSKKSGLVNKAEHHNRLLIDEQAASRLQYYYFSDEIKNDGFYFARIMDRERKEDSGHFRTMIGVHASPHPFVIVMDEYRASEEKVMRFLLHGNGHGSNGTFELNTEEGWAEWRSLDKKLRAHLFSLPQGNLSSFSAIHEESYNRTNYHTAIALQTKAEKVVFITVLDPWVNEKLILQRIANKSGAQCGFLIKGPDKKDGFTLILSGAEKAIGRISITPFLPPEVGEIESDASLILVSVSQELSSFDDLRILANGATYIQIGNRRFEPRCASEICDRFEMK